VFVHIHGGSIIEWDIYASATNLIDTLARRPENEHEMLRRAEKAGKVKVGKASDKDRSRSTRSFARRSAGS